LDYHSFSWSLLFIFGGGCYILIPDQWIWTQEKLAKVMGKEKVEEKEAKLDELGWQITSFHVVQYIYMMTMMMMMMLMMMMMVMVMVMMMMMMRYVYTRTCSRI